MCVSQVFFVDKKICNFWLSLIKTQGLPSSRIFAIPWCHKDHKKITILFFSLCCYQYLFSLCVNDGGVFFPIRLFVVGNSVTIVCA